MPIAHVAIYFVETSIGAWPFLFSKVRIDWSIKFYWIERLMKDKGIVECYRNENWSKLEKKGEQNQAKDKERNKSGKRKRKEQRADATTELCVCIVYIHVSGIAVSVER